MWTVVKTKTMAREIVTAAGTTRLCPPAARMPRSSRTKVSTIQCRRLEEAEAGAAVVWAFEVAAVLQVAHEVGPEVEPWRGVPPPPGNEKKRWP